ncbi:hypothetical protein T459_14447 [Capsicum annuum]|uniref:Ubiquitin-like protease family profile domain-containing protein n=1 Tax=Capsicum annuum TaxID=4072 RepID=A0A2G2ZHG5_CAPAN|nr:hypothetical protein T459_14447 [Capsicum annuum]
MADNTLTKMVTRSISRSDPDVHTVPTFNVGISQSEEDALTSKEVRGIGYKRKVRDEVSSSDNDDEELVKENVRYYVKELPSESSHMCCYSNSNIIADLKEKLSGTQFQMFNKTCFGVSMQIYDCFVQAQLVRSFMSLKLEESSKDALVICINGSTLRFMLKEFAIIIGLNCVTNEDDFIIENKEPNQIVSRYFGGQKTVKKSALIKYFENREWGEGNDDDAVKIAILYFINTFIFLGHNIEAVEDIPIVSQSSSQHIGTDSSSTPKQGDTCSVELQQHINVIFYYLHKKDKYSPPSNYTYTTADCVFKIKVAELWEKLMAGVLWHTVDHVLISLHVKERLHWVLFVVSFLDRSLYIYDSYNSTIHDVYVKTVVQKFAEVIPSSFLNVDFYKKKIDIDWQCHPKYRNKDETEPFKGCGIYVAAYAEFLTGGQGVPNQEFDIVLLHT